MKRIILSLLLIIRFIGSYAFTDLRDAAATNPTRPGNLISIYYEKGFHPSSKGAGVTKLSISPSDKDLRMVNRELVIDQNPIFVDIKAS